MRYYSRNVRRVGTVRMHACNHVLGRCVCVCLPASETETPIKVRLPFWTVNCTSCGPTTTHPKAGTLHVAAVNAGGQERGKDGFRLPRSPFCVTCTRPHTTKFAPTRNTTHRDTAAHRTHACVHPNACTRADMCNLHAAHTDTRHGYK
jgi:hypothetical protein